MHPMPVGGRNGDVHELIARRYCAYSGLGQEDFHDKEY